MVTYTNFYENLKEALLRLRSTVVKYGDEPYYVLHIANHFEDEIFRMYLMPLGNPSSDYYVQGLDMFGLENNDSGKFMDEYMEANPSKKIIRKQMNSPYFNKFRPYPLGMCNYNGKVYFIERMPNRKSEQGLIGSMLYERRISSSLEVSFSQNIHITSAAFKSCVMGEHPPADLCLKAMLDPDLENEAVAFHRNFALVRGPMGMLFLAYKEDVVGVLPNNDFNSLFIDKKYSHVREAVDDLNLFYAVSYK